jgi:hypothetical protein
MGGKAPNDCMARLPLQPIRIASNSVRFVARTFTAPLGLAEAFNASGTKTRSLNLVKTRPKKRKVVRLFTLSKRGEEL